jgi:aldose 1-epimerase
MPHAFRGSRKLLAFFSTCALMSFVVFAASASAQATAKHGHHKAPRHHRGHHHGNGGVTIDSGVPWGTVPGEGPASLYTLSNSNGMVVKITNFGGVVQSIWVPDKRGHSKDVVLGFSSLSDYVNDFFQGHTGTPWPAPGGSGNTYFGAIIGRYANRIANASFPLNGTTYTLDANNGPNTLHGGFLGWNTAVWSAATSTGPGTASLELTNTFKDGEGCDPAQTKTPCKGFPADVQATVVYTLTSDNQLKITYTAINSSSTLDTVINLTNHSYFNLGGEASGTVENQLLQINADQYTPVDENLIPESPFFVNVAGTAYDFRHLTPIGETIRNTNLPDGVPPSTPHGLKQLQIAHGFDNNWVLNGYPGYRKVSTAVDPKTGIVLRTFTDQPGVQFYSSNFLVGDLIGTSGNVYRQTQGFTLETQHYPDSPHHIGDPLWPSVVLPHGGTFNSTTSYQLGVAGGGDEGHAHHRH